ncbi:hypothetical protein [Amycolatopsis sp. cmx-11-51]|uniref:hypothetical protein n=1 Tax=unclassified Amycolatopsis TaxID=2618356 RepID=UPI0039E6082B
MTDSRVPGDNAATSQTPPEPNATATGTTPPDTGLASTPAETGQAAEVDYKALFEQAQAKLSKAEKTA